MRGAGPVALAEMIASMPASALGHLLAQLAALPHRLDVVGCAEKRAEPDPREHAAAEQFRPLAKIAFVQGVSFGHHDDPVGVGEIE